MDDDQILRRLFKDLKREVERTAPPFAAMIRRIDAPSRFPWPRLAAAAALLLILIAVPLAIRRQEPPQTISLSQWHAPTDFLLTIPNDDLLRAVPEIGSTTVPLTEGVTP